VASERDTREAVLRRLLAGVGGSGVADTEVPIALQDLDAADPLRAMLGEVVEALEGARDFLASLVQIHGDPETGEQGYGSSWDYDDDEVARLDRILARLDRILARLRTATEGGADDE
jgi:hypothetical protein